MFQQRAVATMTKVSQIAFDAMCILQMFCRIWAEHGEDPEWRKNNQGLLTDTDYNKGRVFTQGIVRQAVVLCQQPTSNRKALVAVPKTLIKIAAEFYEGSMPPAHGLPSIVVDEIGKDVHTALKNMEHALPQHQARAFASIFPELSRYDCKELAKTIGRQQPTRKYNGRFHVPAHWSEATKEKLSQLVLREQHYLPKNLSHRQLLKYKIALMKRAETSRGCRAATLRPPPYKSKGVARGDVGEGDDEDDEDDDEEYEAARGECGGETSPDIPLGPTGDLGARHFRVTLDILLNLLPELKAMNFKTLDQALRSLLTVALLKRLGLLRKSGHPKWLFGASFTTDGYFLHLMLITPAQRDINYARIAKRQASMKAKAVAKKAGLPVESLAAAAEDKRRSYKMVVQENKRVDKLEKIPETPYDPRLIIVEDAEEVEMEVDGELHEEVDEREAEEEEGEGDEEEGEDD